MEVRDLLIQRALSEATPICHSTGPDSLLPKKKRVSAKPLACRGARDLQLQMFYAVGLLDAPTDEAWKRKAKEFGL